MVSQATANALEVSLRANSPNSQIIRAPVAEDAAAIATLIARCPPLDRNSLYATLLLCTHFSGTCALALQDDRPLAWVSAYLPPTAPDTLFVWQVAVAPECRGVGLGRRLIQQILSRPVCSAVRQLQTTITADNEASWSLFRSVARQANASLHGEPHFFRGAHFGGDHETEHLVTISPIDPAALRDKH